MHSIRWFFAVSMAAVGFAGTWLLAAYGRLDTQSAVGVASVVATLILTPLGWWASRIESVRQPDDAGAANHATPVAADVDPRRTRPQIVVGDIPGEAVAWQERGHLSDRLSAMA